MSRRQQQSRLADETQHAHPLATKLVEDRDRVVDPTLDESTLDMFDRIRRTGATRIEPDGPG